MFTCGEHLLRTGFANEIVVAKGGNEHQERRAWQVKVGEQGIDTLESVAWVDEDIGVIDAGEDDSSLSSRRF